MIFTLYWMEIACLERKILDRKVQDALELNRIKIDISVKGGISMVSAADTDKIVDPFADKIVSHEPLFYIKWYSTEDPTKEVFAIAWK